MTSAALGARLLLSVIGGFLLGSLPFSVWAGRRAGVDVRARGSRNPGAANVWRTSGRLLGMLVGAADAAKGAVAVFAAGWLGLPDDLAIWTGVAAVLGHNYSPLLGFRGGKGGATTCGVLACFVFPEMLVVFVLWVAGWLLSRRRRFLWSMAALSACPIIAMTTGRLPLPYLGRIPPRTGSILAAVTFLVLLLWLRVAPGLRRSDA